MDEYRVGVRRIREGTLSKILGAAALARKLLESFAQKRAHVVFYTFGLGESQMTSSAADDQRNGVRFGHNFGGEQAEIFRRSILDGVDDQVRRASCRGRIRR